MRAAFTVPILLATLAAAAQDAPRYEVFAVRYATIPAFPVSGLIAGAEKDRKIDIAMMVWL